MAHGDTHLFRGPIWSKYANLFGADIFYDSIKYYLHACNISCHFLFPNIINPNNNNEIF